VAASGNVEFRILGRLEVRRGDELLPLGGTKQRALLVLLLAHANEIVSRDRIIDELWGESPPPTVSTALNVHISRLRRALHNVCRDELLVTSQPGYVLRVPPGRIDARRFEQLVADGRGELAEAEPARAARTLGEALSLWRSRPLDDLDDAPFARHERDRLEELRLAALEDRIEADLALGRHRIVIPELEALVGEHPYRERLAAQLMLALYRSGRQAEALATYQRLRRALAGELGLVPSRALEELEATILRHDRSLDAAPEALEAPSSRRRRRGARVLIAVAAAAVIVGLTPGPRGVHDAFAAVGNSIVVIDPKTNHVVGEVPVGGRPGGVATGAGAVWVVNRDDETLLKIDPRTRRVVRTIGLGVEPRGVAVGAGSVWVRTLYGSLLRFDPSTGERVARIAAPRGPHIELGGSFAFGGSAVWFLSEGRLGRLATPTANPVLLTPDRGVLGWGRVAYAQGSVWLAHAGTVLRLDPRSLAVRGRISLADIGLRGCPSLFVDAHDVWVADLQFHMIARIDAATGGVRAVIPLSTSPWDLASGAGALWAAQSDGTVSRIDRATNHVESLIKLGVYPAAGASPTIATGAGAVWVATTSY
jgi:YVTN family beta-propeller protein